jgi:hypothetical protein
LFNMLLRYTKWRVEYSEYNASSIFRHLPVPTTRYQSNGEQ